MASELDISEHGALYGVYREHLRAMTTARQAAERPRSAQSRKPEERKAAYQAFTREMARIEAAHQAWLAAHGLAADLLTGKSMPRIKHPLISE